MNGCVSFGINKVSSVNNTDTRRSIQFLIVNAAAAAKEVQPRYKVIDSNLTEKSKKVL